MFVINFVWAINILNFKRVFKLAAYFWRKEVSKRLSYRKSNPGGIHAFLRLLRHRALHQNYCVHLRSSMTLFNAIWGGKNLYLIECETTAVVKMPTRFSICYPHMFPLGQTGSNMFKLALKKKIIKKDVTVSKKELLCQELSKIMRIELCMLIEIKHNLWVRITCLTLMQLSMG